MEKLAKEKSFASSGLMALVGMALGPLLEKDGGVTLEEAFREPHIPASEKRRTLDVIYAKYGAAPLLGVSQVVDKIGFHPIFHVLLNSADPLVFSQKWLRLEGYYHSNNRVAIEPAGPNALFYRRWSRSGEPPTVPENLLICGFHLGLLSRLGCRGLTCLSGGKTLFADGRVSLEGLLPENETAAEWELTWRDFRSLHQEDPTASQDGLAVERVARLIESDIGRVWSLQEAAKALGYSVRSLQRGLGATGASFTSVVRSSRLNEASRLLDADDLSLADIGYWCGFSDQAHFQRTFKRSTGLTPAQYRKVAAPAAP